MTLSDRHWIEDTIEGAFWRLDNLNKRKATMTERDAFKMVLRGVFAEAQLRGDAAVAELDELRAVTLRLLNAHHVSTRSHSASLCDLCGDAGRMLAKTQHPLSTGKLPHVADRAADEKHWPANTSAPKSYMPKSPSPPASSAGPIRCDIRELALWREQHKPRCPQCIHDELPTGACATTWVPSLGPAKKVRETASSAGPTKQPVADGRMHDRACSVFHARLIGTPAICSCTPARETTPAVEFRSDRQKAAALKGMKLEHEIHANVPDANARASMIHTLEKLWSFMGDAAAPPSIPATVGISALIAKLREFVVQDTGAARLRCNLCGETSSDFPPVEPPHAADCPLMLVEKTTPRLKPSVLAPSASLVEHKIVRHTLPGTPEEWACIHCKCDTRNTGGHFSDKGIECGDCWNARLAAEKLDRWASR